MTNESLPATPTLIPAKPVLIPAAAAAVPSTPAPVRAPAVPLPQSLATGAGDPMRTKRQIQANAVSDGRAAKARWKPLVAEAKATWSKLAPQDLSKVDGNFHVLAGLVQRYENLSRDESNRQVRAFFDKHTVVA